MVFAVVQVGHRLAGQGLLVGTVVGAQQGAGVAGSQPSVGQQVLDRRWQVQEPRILAVLRWVVPPVVAINEAIEIAKRLGGPDSGRFVNGVLDRLKGQVSRPLREAGGGSREPRSAAPDTP
jgi:hypothetical protein